MCRDCSHGGRRCPGDTALARRARRYAAAGKTDPRLQESLPGNPPAVPSTPEGKPEHDLDTAEGIHDRAAELRAFSAENMTLVTVACLEAHEKNGILTQEQAEEIARAHNVPSDFLDYTTGRDGVSKFPVLVPERMEQTSTALGEKANQWLDKELASAKADYDAAVDDWEKAKEAGDADKRYAARDAIQEKQQAYYARKRELMGQLRETGERLDWTTAGTATPARVDQTIQASATFFPKDWIAASNRLSAESTRNSRNMGVGAAPVRVRESTARNHYSPRSSVTKRETKPRRTFYEPESAERADVHNSPAYRVVPEEEWTDDERGYGAGYVLVQRYDVARGPSYFSNDPGANVLDADGNFRLKGRAAAGWEQYTYTSHNGEEKTCWRKPAVTVSTSKEYGVAELTIPKQSGRTGEINSTATHELTHRCEDTNRRIPQLERAFLVRRTTGADGEREKLVPYHSASKGEYVRPDNFIDRYVGKEYANSTQFHEVMSMGMEASFHGRHGGFGKLKDPFSRSEAARDDDHHAFVLGTFLSA